MSPAERVALAWVILIGGATTLIATLFTGPFDGGSLFGLWLVLVGLVALVHVHETQDPEAHR